MRPTGSPTGPGVVVAIEGMNELAGQPDFQRPDGTHVVEDAPDYNPADIPNDPDLDEWFGDASSVAAQGTVTYHYSSELPFSNFPAELHVRASRVTPRGDARRPVDGRPGHDDHRPDGLRLASITQSDVLDRRRDGQRGRQPPRGRDLGVLRLGRRLATSCGLRTTPRWPPGSRSSHPPATRALTTRSSRRPTTRTSSGSARPRRFGSRPRPTATRAGSSDNIATLSSTGTGQPTSLPSGSGKVVDLTAPGYGGEAACSPLVTQSDARRTP